jgi:hypothetical protein
MDFQRIGPALTYPLRGLTPIVFLILGFATAIVPGSAAVLSFFMTVYGLAIIRASAEGQTAAPPIAAAGGAKEWMLDLLRVFLVLLISAWPMIPSLALAAIGRPSMIVFGVGAALMFVYYPACLIVIAKWRSLKMAINLRRVFDLITVLGSDYFGALATTVVLFAILAGLAMWWRGVIADQPASGLEVAGMVYVQLCGAHLLGWAVHRHHDEIHTL